MTIKNSTPSLDVAALVRTTKAIVRLATRGLDKNGLVDLYLEEIPVYCVKRKGGMQAGFHQTLGEGDVGRVVINVGVCFTEERFVSTLIHELAHAVTAWIYGTGEPAHGARWKEVMVQLGQKPTRCHDYKDRK